MDADEYWGQVRSNIESRRVRLLFVADRIPRELLRIVEYLNDQMDKTEVLAIEVRKYASNNTTAYAPRVLGRRAASSERKSGGAIANYAGKTNFEGILAKCEEERDKIQVGFLGGKDKLNKATLAELQAKRQYKWDWAIGGTGPKVAANWLPGSVFLTACKDKKG